jgi:hypothetical protein
MPAKIRHLQPIVRLSHRLFASVQRLAHLAGVSYSEVVEVILTEVLEADATAPCIDVSRPAPSAVDRGGRRRPSVIPIERARRFRSAVAHTIDDIEPLDGRALRQRSAQLRDRAHRARDRAAEVCAAAERARQNAERIRQVV